MNKNGAIGIFDSGVGGLTIWNEILKVLPKEDSIYIADSANAPYGTKSTQEIISLSRINCERLIDKGAKIIVVACNTATTQAIETLRSEFDIPFIGIEPAIKPAAESSVSRSIAVLATNGTLESQRFNKTKDKFTKDVKVVTRVGEGLVIAIENGELHSKKLKDLLSSHLRALISNRTDRLVLGCTHYPLLIPLIKSILGDSIEIVDSGRAVAEQTKYVLEQNNLIADSELAGIHSLFATKNLNILKTIVLEFGLGNQLNLTYSSLYQSE